MPAAAEPLDTVADVETPERVRFQYRLAGPTSRLAAWLLDLVIRGVALVVILIVLGLAVGVDGPRAATGAPQGIVLVAVFALEWVYFVVFESVTGTSPGKKALGLRVVKEGGFPVGFVDASLRNLLRAADFLPVGYLLGGLAMISDRHFRRLGDRVAGTIVVRDERRAVAAAFRLEPPASVDELAAIPARPSLDAEEVEALDMFVRRGPVLAAGREMELAEMIAPALGRRLGARHGNPVRLLELLHHRIVGQLGAGPRGADDNRARGAAELRPRRPPP